MSIWTNSTFASKSATAGYNAISEPRNEIGPSPSGVRKQRAQNIVPVTIKSLLNHDDSYGPFQVAGISAGMVCIVGQLRKVELFETKIAHLVEDDTGTIEAILWLSDDTNVKPTVAENTYVKVIGSIRLGREKTTIMVYRISSVTDIHEVTAHLLEVEITPLRINNIQNITAIKLQKEIMGAMEFPSLKPKREHQLIPEKKYQLINTAFGDTKQNNVYSQSFGRLKVAGSENVLRLIKSCLVDEGIKRTLLYNGLNMKKDTVDNVIEYLIGEGYIYSTIDEDHFKSVEA